MATYAAVISLTKDLEEFLNCYDSIFVKKKMMQFSPFTKEELSILHRSVSLMDSLLLDFSPDSAESYNIECRIRDVVLKTRSWVDFWAVECLNYSEYRIRTMINTDNTALTDITTELGFINEELKIIHDNGKIQGLEVTSSKGNPLTFLNASRRIFKTEGKLVDLKKDLVTMLDNLTGSSSQNVFSIVGMCGIGKTTFIKTLYDDPLVMHHFDVRGWVTISQQYHAREILLGILCCVANVSEDIHMRDDEGIREQVYQKLKGKRYLIVLDDIWDTTAWDYFKRTFSDDNNGSRIVLTTRLGDVAVQASQDTPPFCIRCLNVDESWELLSSKIFVKESCPPELVVVGKQIAFECRVLPLAIVVMAGILLKMEKDIYVWEKVAQSVSSLVMDEVNHCHSILSLSYNHLPDQLKACFLYMGIFPEDYEISVKELTWLWVAEGFIRTRELDSLEEVAEKFVEDLTSRNLIIVKRRRSNGRIKTCCIHDLMRELCLRESKKQSLLQVINGYGQLPLKNLQ